MNTQSEITRLQTARNALRAKAVELGIAQNTAKLDALAAAQRCPATLKRPLRRFKAV